VTNLRRAGRLERVKPTFPRGKTLKDASSKDMSFGVVSLRADRFREKAVCGKGESPEEDETQESTLP